MPCIHGPHLGPFSLKIIPRLSLFFRYSSFFLRLNPSSVTSSSLLPLRHISFHSFMETQSLSPRPSSLTNSPRNHNSHCCKSPEFEFWMVRNPCFSQPNLPSADQLIADGVLLPLHHLSLQPKSQTPESDPPVPGTGRKPDLETGPELSPAITGSSATTVLSVSKRWRDIFKKSEKKNTEMSNPEEKDREKGKKKEKKSGGGGGSSSAELNINIWPFSRSRSDGTRPRLFPGAPVTRRVNSAPCSRSNSAGEYKSRKWSSSPGRSGVHLGRSSPVWQVPRSKIQDPNTEKGSKKATTTTRRSKVTPPAAAATNGCAKTRVLSLNVPTCIGYKQHLSCTSDENNAISAASGSTTSSTTTRTRGRNGGASSGAGNITGSSGNLFNFRSIFSKKSAVTSH